MAARKKRRRSPSVAIPIGARNSNSASALAALDQASPPIDDTGDAAGDPSSQSPAPLASSDSPTSQSSTDTTSPAASSAASKKSAAKSVALSGGKYNGLNRDQLRTAAAMMENELIELRTQVKRQERAIAEPLMKPEDLEEAIGETFGLVGEFAAMKWGEDVELTTNERERLGRVWSIPIAKLVERLTEADPANATLAASIMLAAGCTGGIVMRKARAVKRRNVLPAST